MHALTRGHHLAVLGAVHVHDVVHEASGGVHHAACVQRVAFAREVVGAFHTGHAALLVVYDLRDGHLVGDRTAVLDAGLREVHGHARVVELSVVVNDTALETLLDRGGDVFHHLLGRNEFRTSVTETERKHVVEGQTAEVQEIVPIAVIRNHECLVLHQVGGVGLHASAFAQCLQHEHYVAFLQIAYTAVYEFRRAARRAFREVGLFEQCDAHAARRRVDCDAETRGAAADDDHVPDFTLFG